MLRIFLGMHTTYVTMVSDLKLLFIVSLLKSWSIDRLGSPMEEETQAKNKKDGPPCQKLFVSDPDFTVRFWYNTILAHTRSLV